MGGMPEVRVNKKGHRRLEKLYNDGRFFDPGSV